MIHWYDVVTLCCLVILCAYFIFVLIELFFAPRPARIKFIRDFKKGRFILLYLMSFPLCYIGLIYSGSGFTESVFIAFNKVINFAVLKYEYEELIPLMQQSILYKVTINFIFAFIAINAVMFALSLIGQYISLSIHRMVIGLTHKEKVFIIGEKEENVNIYLSEKSPYKLIIGDFDGKQCNDFYMQKIYYQTPSHHQRLVAKIVSGINRGVVTVVLNTKTDERNIQFCNLFNNEIQKLGDKTNLIKQLRIFVFGSPSFEEIYLDIVKNSKGCIRFVNKYQQIAMDFIDKYPITAFLNDSHYDKNSGLVNKNLNINVLLIGFGNCNKQIFLTSVANNQFITGTTENPTIKKVNYHIFDKDDRNGFKNLNHNYNRFEIESEEFVKEDYLPLPDKPAVEHYYKLDINDMSFYKQIKSIVGDKNSVNLIVVALGSDLENIDLAKKVCAKNKEWGLENCNVFVKSAKYNFCEEYFVDENCSFIGQEKDIFNIENIVCDKFTKMALLRNRIYDLEYSVKFNSGAIISDADRKQIIEDSERKWYLSKTQFERESSLYCCLSLRAKLNLLGLDCVLKEDAGIALTMEEFFARYAKDDMPKFYEMRVEGKPIVKYSCNYPFSTRRNFAVLEHLRWNSFMISKGFIPASKSLILGEKVQKGNSCKYTNGKNYGLRRHGNLTNFQGLSEFAELIAKRDNLTLEQADVISYDYQILDDAFWLLDKVGMKIVEKA